MNRRISRTVASLVLAAGAGIALPAFADQPTPVGEAPPAATAPPEPAPIFDEPTALTPRGKFVVEPAAQYVHSTNSQVALVGYTILPAITIGLINIQRVESNLDNFSLTGRVGITPRVEFEVRAPYIVENTTTETRPLATASVANSFFNASGSGIGDVEAALRTQLNHFHGDNTVYLAQVRFKSHTGTNIFEEPLDPKTDLQSHLATGSGFNAVQAGFTFLKPSDPAVFFGGLAYTDSLGRDVGHGYGHVTPGGILDLNVGMGLALNDRASFSAGYQHSVVDQTQQTHPATGFAISRLGTIQLGTLRFGVSYQLSPGTYLNTTIGIGVTRDSPDLEATVRVPIRF